MDCIIGPLEGPELLTDVRPDDLPASVSDALGIGYLSKAEPAVPWPVVGKIWGKHSRVLFSLPVAVYGADTGVYVHFIFDTGAPVTFVSRDTLKALGIQEWQLGDKVLTINNVRTPVLVSESQKRVNAAGQLEDCHFSGLNILGMNYFDKIDATLTIKFANLTARIDRA